jgi:hypothetical protein
MKHIEPADTAPDQDPQYAALPVQGIAEQAIVVAPADPADHDRDA